MALVHSAFYRFVRLADPHARAAHLREIARELTGSVIVATEGVNGAVAGEENAVRTFEIELAKQNEFSMIVFKRSECGVPPFGRLKVHVKERIVAFGETDEALFDARSTAVSAEAWRELIARDDVVVIDNRNSFEYRLGRFANAVDPEVTHFKDFENYVRSHAENWKRDGKKVAMYCTGGIRCERVAPWMQRLGLEVYELEGGILSYFAKMPDASRDWRGECFVFDNRVALDTQLQQTNTSIEQVFDAERDGKWRIARAKRLLDQAAAVSAPRDSEAD